MKKRLVLPTVLLAVLSISLHADSWTDIISLSGWGRAVVAPYAFSGGDSSVSAATYSDSNVPVIGFTASGKSPNGQIGFVTDLEYAALVNNGEITGGLVVPGYNFKAWVQPFDLIKLTAGAFVEDDFRGTVGNTQFATWLLPNSNTNEDTIFSRFQADLGAHFKLLPLSFLDSAWNGLMIEGALGSNRAPTGSPYTENQANLNLIGLSAADAYKEMQIGIGYKIPGVGLARAQFIGNNRPELEPDYTNVSYPDGQLLTSGLVFNKYADVIEAAFQFNAVKGLNVDAGVKIPLQYTTDAGFLEYSALNPNGPVQAEDGVENITVQLPYQASVGVDWTPPFLRAFDLVARVDTSFGGTTLDPGSHQIDFGTDISVWFLPSYKITDFVKVGTDFCMDMRQPDVWEQPIGVEMASKTSGSGYTDYGIGPWVGLDFGGGSYLKAGVMMMLPGSSRYAWVGDNSIGYQFQETFTGEPVISFPISFTYNF